MKASLKGRARAPTQVSRSGWISILKRTWKRLGDENASILAAGVAFYATLAVFPALGAIVTVYALIADPADVQAHFQALAAFLPGDVAQIFDEQLGSLASREPTELGLGVVTTLLLTVWSAQRGADAAARAITVAYRETETRGFLKRTAQIYLITLVLILFVVTLLLSLIVAPLALQFFHLPALAPVIGKVVGWSVFLVVVALIVAWLFRVAPPRRPARWRWVSLGSAVTTLFWVLGSVGFSWYVGSFGNYNETYGTLGAIAVLLLWFFLSSYALILGAVLNAEAEFQTSADTTAGPDRPIGERDAYVADFMPGTTPDDSARADPAA